MKRATVLVFAIVLMFIGVSAWATGQQEARGATDWGVRDVVIGSGGAGGSWYLLGAQLADFMGKEFPSIIFSSVEGGAVTNVRNVNKGVDMDIGMAALPDVQDALANTGPFTGEGINNVAPIINFATDYVQLTVLASSPIRTLADIRNKRLLPGPRNWGIEFIMRDLLSVLGTDYDGVQRNGGSVSFVSWGEAPSLLGDGHADLAAFKGAYPISNIMELAATHPVRIVPISTTEMQSFMAKRLGFFPGVIPAGTYRGQTTDVPTLGHTSVIFARKDLSEDFVYEFTKRIVQNAKALSSIQGIDLAANPLHGINPDLLHPGAKRYYREAGILK
jgi:hypothetical protein